MGGRLRHIGFPSPKNLRDYAPVIAKLLLFVWVGFLRHFEQKIMSELFWKGTNVEMKIGNWSATSNCFDNWKKHQNRFSPDQTYS